jgi:predicted metal-dependent HD superfamily phosphohydrolase
MFDALPPEVAAELARRYAEPHRAYHTAAHIAEVLGWSDWVAGSVGWAAPRDVYVAIAFHDAIYDPLAKDNEVRSAALAVELVDASMRAQELIVLTARHGGLAPGDVDLEAAHFLDCDTAILGAAPEAFDAYDRAIAVEYRAVPPDAFRAGRRAFLAKLAAQPRIFLSELFHARFDAAARSNVARALRAYE